MKINYFKLSKFFLYLVPFAVVIVTRSTLFPFIVGKYVWFRTAVDLALIAFLLGLILMPREARIYEDRLKKILVSPLTISVILFVSFFLLAGFLGHDPAYSFWSNFERGEGGLQVLHLGLFFLLLTALFKEEEDWRAIFWISIISALLMIGYGLGAGLKYTDAEFAEKVVGNATTTEFTGKGGPLFRTFNSFVGPSFKENGYRFQGSIGNPAYVAGILAFSMFFALYLLGNRTKNRAGEAFAKKNLFSLTLLGIFGFFFLLAATRGAFVGLIAGALTALAYAAYSRKKWRKKLIVLSIILVSVIAIMVYFKNTNFIKSIPGSRIFDLSFVTKTFHDRTIMWRIGWRAFLARPILGWGPESFGFLFQKFFDPVYYTIGHGFGAWFDRAHSIFFDYLAETGILGLLSYLSMFGVACWIAIKNKIFSASPTLFQKSLIIAMPVVYLVQGLALFDVLVIYINIFLFLAFVNFLNQKPIESKKLKS